MGSGPQAVMPCPKCGEEMECDTVDIGVGEMRVSPWGCPACHWFEGKDDERSDFRDFDIRR